jgi:hypothetical protein
MNVKQNQREVVFLIVIVRINDEREYDIQLDLYQEEILLNKLEMNLRLDLRHDGREPKEYV